MTRAVTVAPDYATAALVLADGRVFFGQGVGAKGTVVGEICFNTGMTGYQETLSDPSYAGQIITFTFPHIGNVGVNEDDMETIKPAVKGLVLREPITPPSNYRQTASLEKWLTSNRITGISGVDTRALVRYIRTNGAQNAVICHAADAKSIDLKKLHAKASGHPTLEGMELAMSVTGQYEKKFKGKLHDLVSVPDRVKQYKVVAIDYGAKQNIMRHLNHVFEQVIVVPADTKASDILAQKPDGVFLSNGPGDPAATGAYAIEVIKEIMDKGVPIFGICMGHQLLSLALGCKTKKMHQGHRGANHPVQHLATGRVEITSQNHGFVVDEDSLPNDVQVTHRSLFDKTIEGIKHSSLPVFSVQYHPESSPGPHDSHYLFYQFVHMIADTKKSQNKVQKAYA